MRLPVSTCEGGPLPGQSESGDHYCQQHQKATILRDKRDINTINTTNNTIVIRNFDIIRKLASVSAMSGGLARTEGDVRAIPLHIGRTGDHDDDETECDENDSNVADGDVRRCEGDPATYWQNR